MTRPHRVHQKNGDSLRQHGDMGVLGIDILDFSYCPGCQQVPSQTVGIRRLQHQLILQAPTAVAAEPALEGNLVFRGKRFCQCFHQFSSTKRQRDAL